MMSCLLAQFFPPYKQLERAAETEASGKTAPVLKHSVPLSRELTSETKTKSDFTSGLFGIIQVLFHSLFQYFDCILISSFNLFMCVLHKCFIILTSVIFVSVKFMKCLGTIFKFTT